MHPAPHHSHHLRFYIVMVTVVVGVILVLLFLNNDGNPLSITNAVIGGNNNETIVEETGITGAVTTSTKRSGSKTVEFTLTTDQIPEVEKEVTLSSIMVDFTDASTIISVGGDRLETLNNLDGVKLVIEEFEGDFLVDDTRLSLDGEAKRIEVSGIALSPSSSKDLKISFKDLDYDHVTVEDIELSSITFPAGDGELTAERLSYSLDRDEAIIQGIVGNLEIDTTTTESTKFIGTANKLTIDGDSFDLSLE